MSYSGKDYWRESLEIAADECELSMTPEQLAYMADAMDGSHENYGMAFYSPPSTDRIAEIEREWKGKLVALQRDFDRYIANAETAVKQALRQHRDARISIGENGEVRKFDGRSDRIQ